MIKKLFKAVVLLVLLALLAMIVLGASFYYNWWGNGDPDGEVFISIDGVTEVFEDLTEHRDDYDSIFDNETLGFLKYCHDTYGAKFTLYCYFESDDFSLTMAPETYREEFEQQAEWLRFGFCGNSEDSPSIELVPDQLGADFTKFAKEMVRITGDTFVDLRLADRKMGPEAVKALKDRGVRALFTVSDEKAGYYFTQEQNAAVMAEDYYVDEANKMTFVTTDLCLDEGRVNAVYNNLIMTALNSKQHSMIAVCAQESSFDASMKEKIENVCKFTDNYEYDYAVFEDVED